MPMLLLGLNVGWENTSRTGTVTSMEKSPNVSAGMTVSTDEAGLRKHLPVGGSVSDALFPKS